ncbi:MAG: DNA-binding MarR family transcriptional regulator [Crocinitomix sp.]|jgi:DNA-binding MarR family transcriptional regulator
MCNFCDYIAVMNQHPNLESCDPRQCISSRILKCNRIISNVFRKHLLPYNITNSQMSILFIVAKRGEATQQELATILYLEKSTISRNMKRLFDGKLISKQNSKQIEITEAGKDFLEEIIPAWDEAMEESRALLTAQGEEALTILLNQLTHA